MDSRTAAITRPPSSVILYTLLIFGLWSAYVATAYGRVEQLGPVMRPVVNELVRALIFGLPVAVLIVAAGVSSPLAYLKLNTSAGLGVRWGALAGCALLALNAGLALVVSQDLELELAPVPVEAYFTSLGVATLIEEIAFRGFLLQQLSTLVGFWAANACSAFLFAAIHLPGWILVGATGIYPGKLGHLASIFVLGLALGYLFRRTRSLWSCFLLHAANNLAAIIFFGA